MTVFRAAPAESTAIGIGDYPIGDAARLLRAPARNLTRWMKGYSYKRGLETVYSPPLWAPEIGRVGEEALEIGFRDLIELRFVLLLLENGLSLLAIRVLLAHARRWVQDERPFSTRQFRTDGRAIWLETTEQDGFTELLDVSTGQLAMKPILERCFKDLDFGPTVVERWRPFRGKNSIVVDPTRSFGRPIAAVSGVPTGALDRAVRAEGSERKVAALFDVSPAAVRDAVAFEASLRAA